MHDDSENIPSRRRADRSSLMMMAPLARRDGEPLGEGRVRNLSATGLMIECARDVDVDDPVVVTLRTIGPVYAKVCWAAEGRLGLAFDVPIDPALVRRKIGASPQSGQLHSGQVWSGRPAGAVGTRPTRPSVPPGRGR